MGQEIKTKFLSTIPKSKPATDATQAIKDEYEKTFNLEIQVKYLLVSTMEPELLKGVFEFDLPYYTLEQLRAISSGMVKFD